MTAALVALVIFAIAMVVIGVVSSKRAGTMDGFLLGGRKMGAWMSAFAYGTSYFSAVIFVGYAGKNGWDIGLAAVWIGVGNALIGCLLAWKLMAKRVRNMTHALKARTMPEFFSERYGSKPMKLFAAVLIFVFLVPYAASVYKGLGTLFSAIFPQAGDLIPGVSANMLCMFIVAVLTGFYLILGGYVAVALSDFIQGIIMIVGVIILVVAVTLHGNVGGIGQAISSLKNIQPSLVSVTGGSFWRFLLLNILLTSVGTFGLPQMVHKFYAVKDERAIRRATVVSTGFAMIIGCGAYFFGSMGRLILSNNPPLTASGAVDYDSIVPTMLMSAFSSGLAGQILIAVIMVLLLSASMSTLSSVVLSSSTAVSIDFIKVLRPGFKDKTQMVVTRALCLVFVALSFIFANFNFAIIVSIMSYSWGIVSGCFIGPFLWGLFSKKITKAGAWSGMLAGFITVVSMAVIWTASNNPGDIGLYNAFKLASTESPLFGVSAMGVSLVVVPLVSLFTKKPDEKLVGRAFSKPAA